MDDDKVITMPQRDGEAIHDTPAGDTGDTDETSLDTTLIVEWGYTLGLDPKLINMVLAVQRAKDLGISSDTLMLIAAIKLEAELSDGF